MKTVLFVDGENFQKKVKQAFRAQRLTWDDYRFGRLQLHNLIATVFPSIKIDDIRYYVARLHVYPETREKSEQLVALQRALKSNLENQKIKFVMSGNVRMFKLPDEQAMFREKGVDVRMAVDAVSLAADKKLKTAIICSSDSDMQPVVQELKRRKVRVIYLGFQVQPNKGLIFTCDEAVLIRNNELKAHMPKEQQPKRLKIKINRFDDE